MMARARPRLIVRILGRCLGIFVGRVDPYSRRTVSFTGDLRDDLAGTRLGRILDTVADGILIADRQGHLRFANTAAEALLGLDPGEAGRSTYNTRDWRVTDADGGPLAPAELPIARVIATGLPVHDVEYAFERPDGRRVIVAVNAAPLHDEAGRLSQVVATLREITDRKRAEQALEHQALHDGLTALPNRVLLHQRLRRALQSTGGDRRHPVALIVLDLDRFKEVNDTFGHGAGDALLQQVGRRLEASLRPTDTLARLGGDEFAALLPETAIDRATAVVSRLLGALEQPFRVEGHDLFVDASFGIAVSPDHGQDADALLRQADVAMYVAKRSGGGYAVYTPDQDRHSRDRLTLTSELRQAIQRDELVLHFQPQISLKTGQIRGVEALVRWPHPDRGLIGPDGVVPLAEEMGLIDALTRWVLNAALAQGQTWRQAGLTFPVSVNLSARNLQADHLPDTVSLLLGRWDAPPGSLRLEVREAAIVDDPARGRRVLTSLGSLGVGLSIDNVGRGAAAPADWKQIPLDELKIDPSIVRQVAEDESDRAIARATIDLGHSLGVEVVAVGVEDRAAWDLLAQLGCDAIQGYAIAPPQPAADLERWLAEDARRLSARG